MSDDPTVGVFAGLRIGNGPETQQKQTGDDVRLEDHMSTEPTDAEIVHAALDALLLVVDRSASDLRAFHDTVSQTPVAGRPPFPRVAVATTQSIIDHLKTVEEKLQEVMVALGLTHSR